MGDGNGTGKSSGVESREVDTVLLTYDRATDRLGIAGHCNSLDLMLDILARATRTVKNKWKTERTLELREQLRQQADAQRIADSLRNGR